MLEGCRVLDLTDEKGQLCGKLLGDLGADVLKIEPPGGDPARRLGPFYQDTADPERSLFWFAYNNSKRSVSLNIETPGGRSILRTLARSSDILLESFAPGFPARLGLGYNDLRDLNPRLIVVSITPFGQNGPASNYLDTDLITMARGGLLYICGDEQSPPSRNVAPQSYSQAGVQAAVACMLALRSRSASGRGQFIDLSMQEAVTNALITVQQTWDVLKKEEKRGNHGQRGRVLSNYMWPCKDGYVAWCWWVAPGFGNKNIPVLEWMGEEGMAGDLWEVDWEGKSTADITQEEVDHWEEVYGKFLRMHTVAETYEQAVRRRIMLFPVNTPKEVVGDSQLRARGFFNEIRHPELGVSLPYPGAFYKSTDGSPRVRRRPPFIGEHNEDIYMGELGLAKEDLAVLKATHAI